MTRNRKKIQIWLIVLSFFQVTNAKIDAQRGQSLHNIVCRIGNVIDFFDSKLDVLDLQHNHFYSKLQQLNIELHGLKGFLGTIALQGGKINKKQDKLLFEIEKLECIDTCEILIFQDDIPFVIKQPGVYCLAESVESHTDAAITISADNVLLDLNEKKIDGKFHGDVGIVVESGLENITIQNGTLCNMCSKGIDADAIKNIATVPMSITDSLIDSVVDVVECIAPIRCLQIKNVKIVHIGNKKLCVNPVCTTDYFLSPIIGININCAVEVLLDNCQVLSCHGHGFVLQTIERGIMQSCDATQNGSNGFIIKNADTSRFACCESTMNGFNGFYDIACNGDNMYSKCIAKQNGLNGFYIKGGGKVLQECVASQNNYTGFNLITPHICDGSLDDSFGCSGKVSTNFGGDDYANAVAMQKNGKIVVVGTSNRGGANEIAIARYHAEGSLDMSFGLGGKVTTDFGGDDFGNAVAMQKDGKIVVAGTSIFVGSNDFIVARYNIDGSLDMSFGTGGKVTTDFGGDDRAKAMAVQEDGKIVVVGRSRTEGGLFAFAIARYNEDGSLDEYFGVGGKVITDFGGSDFGNSVVLQKDCKIVVAGSSNRGENADFAVARYNEDGSLDNYFGTGGIVTTSFGGFDFAKAVALQKNNKILVAGTSKTKYGSKIAIARYHMNGSLDETFGTEGRVVTHFDGLYQGCAEVIQKDGKIIIVGKLEYEEGFVVLRYTIHGELDETFGTEGRVITKFGKISSGHAATLQKDGKIVAVGATGKDFAMARYVTFKRGVAVRDCIAEENGEHGFDISGTAYNLRDSVAINNVINGFLLEPLARSCQLLSNESLKNNNIGIENLGKNNQVFNNRAHDNTNSNYAGVPLVIKPKSTTSFWANVVV